MKFISTNPATGAQIAEYPEHSAAEVEAIVATAHAAHRSWSALPVSKRAEMLARLAQLLEERADDYAALIVSEMGKPFAEARGEVVKAAGGARHFAENAETYLGDEPIPGTPGVIHYESLGVILGIMPWNLPFWQVLRFFIPTALAGNVVIDTDFTGPEL